MIALARKAANRLLQIAIAPFIGLRRGVAAGSSTVWVLHGLLVAGVLIGLWWLNGWLGMDQVVHAPSRILRQLWLPAVFAFGYASLAAAYATLRVITEPDAASPYPELDRAWSQASEALERSGIDHHEKALVLVLGQPSETAFELIEAAEVNPTFGPVPTDAAAPIRVWANDEAVYLVCHETSVLSACSQRIAAERRIRRGQTIDRPAAAVERQLPVALQVSEGSAAEPFACEGPYESTDASGEAFPRVTAPVRLAHDTDHRPCRPLLTAEQSEDSSDQLDHLLTLLRRDREPGLPIDAIAVVIPCDAVSQDQRVCDLADAIQSDLDVIRQTAGVNCPVLAIGSDLQHLDGCGLLLHNLSTEQRRRLLGVGLPVTERRSEASLRDSVAWLTGSVTPALCQRLLQIEAADTGYEENTSLFRFQTAVADRSDPLAELLSRGLSGSEGKPWPLVGLYLVATGDALGGSQGFGSGVLSQLTASRTDADWTDQAVRDDSQQSRWITTGYASVAAATLFVAGLLVF